MENVLFIFNIILTVVFTVELTGCYILYKKSKQKDFLYISILFILLIIENSIISLSEFSFSFEKLYETSNLLYIVIYTLFLAIIFVVRKIASLEMNDNFSLKEVLLLLLLPIIISSGSFLISFTIGELSIYLCFYLALIYVCLRAYIKHKTKSVQNNISYFAILLLSVGGNIESILYYFSYSDKEYLSETISLDYRNIAFEFMKFLICIIVFLKLKKNFDKQFNPQDLNEESINSYLQEFCISFNLTNRQKEIIKLIIDGYSNKEISSELNITEGTVKTHIYNIFKKADISSRNQLLKKIIN